MQVSILYALFAGIISFLSPCVLPLVPGYVSMLSGIGIEQLRAGQPSDKRLPASSLAFVGGFSIVFISPVPRPAPLVNSCCIIARLWDRWQGHWYCSSVFT